MAQPCTKENEIKEIRDMTIELRSDFKYVKSNLDEIRNNHLAHMQESLDAMDKRLDSYDQFKYKAMAWAAVGAFGGGLLIQVLIKFLLK